MDVNEGTNPASGAQESSLSDIITGASAGADPAGGDLGAGSGDGASGKFKFSGREWDNQQAAEKWANKTYGQLSESQGIIKMVKAILQDPERLRAASQDPNWAPILAKLGIEAAEDELGESDEPTEEGEANPADREQELGRQLEVRMHRFDLKMELADLQEEIGRKMTDEEWNATLKLIQKHQSLTARDAYFLANRERIMSAQQKKLTEMKDAATKKARPRPLPTGVPGTHFDLKKKVEDMSDAEFREYVKSTPDFQALVSRE